MATPPQNMMDKANRIVELAHGLEQAAANERTVEVGVCLRSLMIQGFSMMYDLRDVDPQVAEDALAQSMRAGQGAVDDFLHPDDDATDPE